MAFVNMHIFSLTFLHFDVSLLLLTVTLRGYLISIAYCLFFHFHCLVIIPHILNTFRYTIIILDIMCQFEPIF